MAIWASSGVALAGRIPRWSDSSTRHLQGHFERPGVGLRRGPEPQRGQPRVPAVAPLEAEEGRHAVVGPPQGGAGLPRARPRLEQLEALREQRPLVAVHLLPLDPERPADVPGQVVLVNAPVAEAAV